MMTIMTTFMIYLNLMKVSSSLNPVRTMAFLLIFSIFTLLKMMEITGKTMYTMILALLFIGGILIMFMILSSLSPNEKFKTSKETKMMKTMIFMSILLMMNPTYEMSMNELIKFYCQTPWILMSMGVLITAYFLSFLEILSKENLPMQSFSK